MLHALLDGILSDAFFRDDVKSFLVFFANLEADSVSAEATSSDSSQGASVNRRQYIPSEIQSLLSSVPTEVNQTEVDPAWFHVP